MKFLYWSLTTKPVIFQRVWSTANWNFLTLLVLIMIPDQGHSCDYVKILTTPYFYSRIATRSWMVQWKRNGVINTVQEIWNILSREYYRNHVYNCKVDKYKVLYLNQENNKL